MSDSTKIKSDEIVAELFSTKAATVMEALEKVKVKGKAKMVIPLLKTYKAWESDQVIREKIEGILKQIKTESAIPELIEALDDPEFDDERALIISAFWNAGLFPENDLAILVKHAIRGDYMVTLEALTVIENIEAEIEPEILQDAIFDIEEFLESYPDAPQAALLNELKDVITAMYNI